MRKYAYLASIQFSLMVLLFSSVTAFKSVRFRTTAEALGRHRRGAAARRRRIEMIHTYSLIHDDLPAMDDDELRRGKPTCHVAFGEDVAILAGDGLFAEALRLGARQQEGEPANVLAAVRELGGGAGVSGMVGGQYLDVTHRRQRRRRLRHLHELKTGALIAASVGCDPALGAGRTCHNLPFAASRPSWAWSSRSSTTSST